jgi:hypothetical protein
MVKRILGTFLCSTLDFLNAIKIKINVIPIGARAKVSKGNTEKAMLITVKMIANIKNVFLMFMLNLFQ